MIAGLIAKEVPFLFLVTLAALPQLAVTRASRLAAALGYGRVAGFAICLWPALYRQIRLPVFAVLVYSVSVVGRRHDPRAEAAGRHCRCE